MPIKAVPRSAWPEGAALDENQLTALHEHRHDNPADVLGWHEIGSLVVVRVWHRELEAEGDVVLILGDQKMTMERRGAWLYEVVLDDVVLCHPRDRYYTVEVTRPGEEPKQLYDSYAYNDASFSATEILKFQSGFHPRLGDEMGCHCMEMGGVFGLRFTVWAPKARHIMVISDFNGWDSRAHPMKRCFLEGGFTGVWELFVPFGRARADVPFGQKYMYKIVGAHGGECAKVDPFAQEFEVPPVDTPGHCTDKFASVISEWNDDNRSKSFGWEDEQWLMRRRAWAAGNQFRRQPMAIYEVHLPSWRKTQEGQFFNYKELAPMIIQHMKALHFNWLELMPCAHHPFDGSWGYQVTGQYAVHSRLGTPDDFKFFINAMHKEGIGVLMDYVPAHFCKDEWALINFDGSATFEYEDPREGEQKQWGTRVFNFRRNEVRAFLLGAPLFWIEKYHIDGFRVDAVSAMIYKNFGRKDGEWIPNEQGGDSNLEAVSLLREMNKRVKELWPGVIMCAEESTAWSGVTGGLEQPSGLGFDFKWDLGWMNDTLSYLSAPTSGRPEKDKLTFRDCYMQNERWILPLSHDEVVHGKGSLVDKMSYLDHPPFFEKTQLLKALYGYQVASPGRPLLFMGGEFAQGREWNYKQSLDWHESEEELRSKISTWVSDLMGCYQHFKPMHAGDDEPHGALRFAVKETFKWTENNKDACVAAFARFWHQENVIWVVCNFSPNQYPNYAFGVPVDGEWKVLLNSDDWRYGGRGHGPANGVTMRSSKEGRFGFPACLWFDVPPLSCLVLLGPEPGVHVDVDLADLDCGCDF